MWFCLQWSKKFVFMRQNKETYVYTEFVEMKVPMFEKFGTNSVYVKGQLISNYLFGVIVSIKIATRIL